MYSFFSQNNITFNAHINKSFAFNDKSIQNVFNFQSAIFFFKYVGKFINKFFCFIKICNCMSLLWINKTPRNVAENIRVMFAFLSFTSPNFNLEIRMFPE